MVSLIHHSKANIPKDMEALNLKELIQMIFNMKLTHLGSEASVFIVKFADDVSNLNLFSNLEEFET